MRPCRVQRGEIGGHDRQSRRALLGAGLGWAACALCTTAARAAAVNASPQPIITRWPRGRATPTLTLPDLDGQPWRATDGRGQVVALHFWASWCEPCLEELPSLALAARTHAADGLRVVTVNHKESDAVLRAFLAAHPLTLPVLRDRDGAAARAWGVRLFPSTVLIGRDGRARLVVAGAADWSSTATLAWLKPELHA